jgi:hypothetical protein
MSEASPLELFMYAMKSKATKERYQRRLKNFFDFLGYGGDLTSQAKLFIVAANRNGKNWVFANLMKFLTFQKERVERGEITNATVRNYYKPLKLFLEMNDIELSWKKISKGVPRGRRHGTDRAPTVEEILKLVDYPDRRIKSIVFTMCSSGIRLGAWDYLRFGNLKPIERDGKIVAAKIIVYAGDEEQYNSFVSLEAYQELKKWMDFRKESGESTSESSWLMRDLWNIEKHARGMVTLPKKLTSLGIKRLIERALKAQGIRKELPLGQKRHEFQADHGFRKFFKTRSEQIMRPINVETLMGHSTGISDSYYKPNEKELLDDYLKATDELTFLPENRKELQLRKQEGRISDLERNQAKMKHLEEGLNIFGALLAEQHVKNNIWENLENPSHHHTKDQIESLKKFCIAQSNEEAWHAFVEWVKNAPTVFPATSTAPSD